MYYLRYVGYREALEEYRVVVPGVAIIFSFLLTVPFSPRFEQLDVAAKNVFVVALAASALSLICHFMPASFHKVKLWNHKLLQLLSIYKPSQIVGDRMRNARIRCARLIGIAGLYVLLTI